MYRILAYKSRFDRLSPFSVWEVSATTCLVASNLALQKALKSRPPLEIVSFKIRSMLWFWLWFCIYTIALQKALKSKLLKIVFYNTFKNSHLSISY